MSRKKAYLTIRKENNGYRNEIVYIVVAPERKNFFVKERKYWFVHKTERNN